MDISGKLTAQRLQEIMMDIYKKGNESEDLGVKDLIDDIKKRIISDISK